MSIQHIFNYCILTCTFPNVFKTVKVIPIYKKGNRADYDNYRHISIVTIVSKVFEFILNKQIMIYFEQNTLFIERHFGFKYGHSTGDAVIALIKTSKW